MNLFLTILIGALTAVGGAGGTWLLALSGLLNARVASHKNKADAAAGNAAEHRLVSETLIREALELVTTVSTQFKDFRVESANEQQAQALEIQALQDRIRLLEQRVQELEHENSSLKVQLYDKTQRGPTRHRTP